MADKESARLQAIRNSWSDRPEVIKRKADVKRFYELLMMHELVTEIDLSVTRDQAKQLLVKIKEQYDIDVLTVNRGRQTVGWILASTIIKQ